MANETIYERQSLEWCHRIRINLFELIDDRMSLREQPELFLLWSLHATRAFFRNISRATSSTWTKSGHDLLSLEQGKQFSRPVEHHDGKPGQPSHFDAVRPVRAARNEAMEKEHAIACFLHFHAIVTSCY